MTLSRKQESKLKKIHLYVSRFGSSFSRTACGVQSRSKALEESISVITILAGSYRDIMKFQTISRKESR